MFGIDWGAIEWGTAGEWFSGLGGFLAVAVAVWFGFMEHRRANAAQAEARADGERARLAIRREGAARISIRAGSAWQTGDSPTLFHAEVHNAGQSMFRNVIAVASWGEDGEISDSLGAVPPSNLHKAEVESKRPPAALPKWRIEYTDVHGLRWSHSAAGALTEIGEGHRDP